jgi:hypothetical protein
MHSNYVNRLGTSCEELVEPPRNRRLKNAYRLCNRRSSGFGNNLSHEGNFRLTQPTSLIPSRPPIHGPKRISKSDSR